MILTTPTTAISKSNEKVVIPDEIITSCEYYGSMYGICPEILEAIIWVESRCKRNAVNDTCVGICQINKSSQSERLYKSAKICNTSDILDYDVQIRTACDLIYELCWISADEENDIGYVLMAYNGDSNADDYLKGQCGLSWYANEVLTISAELEREHGK